MRFRSVVAALVLSLVGVGVASASTIPIAVYTAPNKTYANTANTPCVFYGSGLSGCSKDPAGWPDFATSTGNPNPFDPYPLVQTYAGTDLLAWNSVVGDTFVLGLDINQASTDQTLDVFTISFFGPGNTLLKEYAFTPPTAVPDKANGVGYADYVLAAGCSGLTVGTGVDARCVQGLLNGPTYTPFTKPTGTTSIVFNFGLTNPNDGSDKIFVIPTSPIGTPTQNCVDDPTIPGCEGDPVVPEPASLVLLGSGLLIGWAVRRRKR